jgi:hypothetical protein
MTPGKYAYSTVEVAYCATEPTPVFAPAIGQ